MDGNEQYVRSRLDDVYWDKRFFNELGDIVHLGWSICAAETEEKGWELAAAWTRQREEEIRQLDREIELLQGMCDPSWIPLMGTYHMLEEISSDGRDHATASRTLGRLQAALRELKRGLKEQQS